MALPLNITDSEYADCAAIVLCGGLGTRMGTPKPWLTLGSEFLLQRIVRVMEQVVPAVAVIAAPGQSLPELPDHVRRFDDEHPGRGPLEAIRTGVTSLSHEFAFLFVTGCDLPFLEPAVVRRMLDRRKHGEWIVPRVAGHLQPLCSVVDCGLLPIIRHLQESTTAGPRILAEHAQTVEIEAESIRDVDPALRSFMNLNTMEDYATAQDVWKSQSSI